MSDSVGLSGHRRLLGLLIITIAIALLACGASAGSLIAQGHKLDRQCVSDYIAAAATAQAPRAAAAVVQAQKQRDLVRAEKNLGFHAPKTDVARESYLAAGRAYDRAVRANPIPALPGCLE